MKKLKQLASRLRARFAPRQGKSGSSLAFVVTIGAALVIWVMAIMPTMTATGTAAVKLQNSQSDYLDGKSAIEYAKSELLYIVKSGKMPYTFAVIRDGSSGYFTIAKYDSAGGINSTEGYDTYVDFNNDVPWENDSGKQVAAICAVTKETNSYVYKITITAYTDCEPGQKYTTKYTGTSRLLIYPEAYNQTQALPLSDFVLVDGQLGDKTVWNSTISWTTPSTDWFGRVSGGVTATNFTETLIAATAAKAADADAGKYPAVFKTTALPAVPTAGDASDTNAEGTALINTLTQATYIMPTVSDSAVNGAIKYENSKVQMYLDGSWTDISSNCNIYYNGSATAPSAGPYVLTVDYKGGNTCTVDGSTYTVLPATGLTLYTNEATAPTAASSQISSSNVGIAEVKYNTPAEDDEKAVPTITVTLINVNGARYGYTKTDSTSDPVKIDNWQSGRQFTLPADGTYYFYCYIPDTINADGTWTTGKLATYCGMVAPFAAVSELTADESGNCGDYLILGGSGSTVFAMDSSLNTLQPQVSGDIATGAVVYGSSLDFTNYKWTVGTSGDKYTLRNTNSGNYLQLTGEVSYFNVVDRVPVWSCNLSVGNSPSNGDFTVTFASNSSVAHVSRSLSYKYIVTSYTTTRYLSITNSAATQSDNSNSTVYFVKVPVDKHPDVVTPGFIEKNTYSLTYNQKLSEAGISGTVYLNGESHASDYKPNAGKYNVVSYDSATEMYTYLGTLTVSQSTLTAPTIRVDTKYTSSDDDLYTVVTGTWDANGGTHYFGYKADGESNYHWFSSAGDSYTFRLYGSYTFAVKQGNTNNYTFADTDQDESAKQNTLEKLPKIDLKESDKGNFTYSRDPNTGAITWIKMPEVALADGSGTVEINVNRILPDVWYKTASTTWTHEYDSTAVGIFVGINVVNSDWIDPADPNNLDKVYKVTSAYENITFANGRTSSVLRGTQLYFMGEGSGINTYGNKIYLNADLLVIDNGITSTDDSGAAVTGGGVIVNPYSTTGDCTLVYFGTNYGSFEAGIVYEVAPNTDLCNPQSTQVKKLGEPTSSAVVAKSISNPDLEINLDIAYATKDQLQQIVSGETIGWTDDGVLSGDTTSDKASTKIQAQYAVCAYITDISGTVNHTANRVLIAAQEFDSNGDLIDALTVPANLSFTTRYLSIETDSIVQGSSDVAFKVYNLGQNQNFISAIINGLYSLLNSEYSTYSSKTLQVDYECPMYILDSNGAGPQIKAQICRYEDDGTTGVDLFTQYQSENLLMVPYTASELANLYKASAWSDYIATAPKYSRIVERYVQLSGDDSKTITFDNRDGTARYNLEMSIYANYIYFDDSVQTIIARSGTLFGKLAGIADITIDTQENGYAAGEYLQWFGSSGSTESYSGTLINIKNQISYTYQLKTGTSQYEERTVTIAPGFYYLPTDPTYHPDGYSLSELAKPSDETKNNDYYVDVDDIADYAIYVNPDGTISQAYVDTGLIVSGGSTAGSGFSGGSVG